MRPIIGIVLLIVGIGTMSCHWDGMSARSAGTADVRWVRTADGWEWSARRPTTVVAEPPGLHPLVLAAGQGMFSLLALAAVPVGERRDR